MSWAMTFALRDLVFHGCGVCVKSKEGENAGGDAHRCRSRRQAEQMFLPLNTVMSLALSQKMQAG